MQRTRKREKFVEWESVSIPKTYYNAITDVLKTKKSHASVSEWLRSKIEIWLKEEMKMNDNKE